eukprot:gene1564-2643_t
MQKALYRTPDSGRAHPRLQVFQQLPRAAGALPRCRSPSVGEGALVEPWTAVEQFLGWYFAHQRTEENAPFMAYG